jgi:tritrans,polycis-undecaprenyl-diphosphate synthase [geranylgeranyl-diphosphate specific]
VIEKLTRIRVPSPVAGLLYRTYEKRLEAEVRKHPVPAHVGVIMDGNRRLARALSIRPWEGHELGSNTVEELVEWSRVVGVHTLTLYAFSTENFDRAPDEVEALMGLFAKKLAALAEDARIHRNQVRVRVLGRREMLPPNVRASIDLVEHATGGYGAYHLNFCIAYGARQEITDAVRALITKVQDGEMTIDQIDEDVLGQHMYTGGDDPDLIIRTGGEARLSNFLLYQAAYSELFFTDVYFPAFRKTDFLRVLRAYQQRARRFGR